MRRFRQPPISKELLLGSTFKAALPCSQRQESADGKSPGAFLFPFWNAAAPRQTAGADFVPERHG
jgi:hypothetical protein